MPKRPGLEAYFPLPWPLFSEPTRHASGETPSLSSTNEKIRTYRHILCGVVEVGRS